jgi:catechol 2,3-dioxygenase-like lactoylglutathione lyase family enzyme
MHLEHLNLGVNNIENTLTFYRAAFPHWRIRDSGEDEGASSKWVHFGDDRQFLTFNETGSADLTIKKDSHLGFGHMGYVVVALDALVTRLTNAGFEGHHYGAQNPYRENVYFYDPNGLEVEFVEYLSDIPSERNSSD